MTFFRNVGIFFFSLEGRIVLRIGRVIFYDFTGG